MERESISVGEPQASLGYEAVASRQALPLVCDPSVLQVHPPAPVPRPLPSGPPRLFEPPPTPPSRAGRDRSLLLAPRRAVPRRRFPRPRAPRRLSVLAAPLESGSRNALAVAEACVVGAGARGGAAAEIGGGDGARPALGGCPRGRGDSAEGTFLRCAPPAFK